MSAGDAESAAVLTPYNGQVRLIRGILKSKCGDLYNKVCAPSVPSLLQYRLCTSSAQHCENQTKLHLHPQWPCHVLELAVARQQWVDLWLAGCAMFLGL